MTRPIQVMLADDHAIVRDGLSHVIRAQADMEVAALAATGSAVFESLRQVPVDVIVLDLSMPEMSGLEMVRRLVKEYLGLRVVIFSMYPEDQLGRSLVEAGAMAYLNKSRSPLELVDAIREAAVGKQHLTDTMVAQAKDEALPHTRLSSREQQVFLLLIEGHLVSDVAHTLGISPSTASNHVARVREKLGVDSIAAMVSYAHRVGLLGG